MDMIDTNYNPVALAPMQVQLTGPWAIARGQEPKLPPAWSMALSVGSAVVSGYHGTRRNNGSIFWGVVWFALGAIFPVVTPVVGVAQGFGQKRNICPGPALAGLGRIGTRCRSFSRRK